MQRNPHVGELGRSIDVVCRDDLSTATNPSFLVQKPNGDTVTWEASVVQEGDAYILRYITKDGDFNEAGPYKIHPYITVGGWTGPADDVLTITVKELFS
jgi:hypothetical protein